jgi:hypothetical protein
MNRFSPTSLFSHRALRVLPLAGTLALAGAVLPASSASAASGACTGTTTVTCTFTETGSAQTWTVPSGISQATFTLYGAKGGGGGAWGSPGLGAEVTATEAVTAGTVLQVNVGQAGVINGGPTFGGGGIGSASGGGASDIRTPASDGSYPLANRLLVAGGGGGAGIADTNGDTGASGGTAGSAGSTGPSELFNGVTLGGGAGGGAGTSGTGGTGGTGGQVSGANTC